VSFARATTDPGFAPRPEIATPDIEALSVIGNDGFDDQFGDTPFSRPGRDGMRRNAAAVVANSADT